MGKGYSRWGGVTTGGEEYAIEVHRGVRRMAGCLVLGSEPLEQ